MNFDPARPISRNEAALLAEKMVSFANKEGFWPTIDLIVKRWIFANPLYAASVKQGVADARSNLMDDFGSNMEMKGRAMDMRRIAEIPVAIMSVMDILFGIEIKNYDGGKKKFYQDFAKRYPIFSVAKKI